MSIIQYYNDAPAANSSPLIRCEQTSGATSRTEMHHGRQHFVEIMSEPAISGRNFLFRIHESCEQITKLVIR